MHQWACTPTDLPVQNDGDPSEMTAKAASVESPTLGGVLQPTEEQHFEEELDELDAEIEKLFTADDTTAQSALDGLLAIGSSALLSPPLPPAVGAIQPEDGAGGGLTGANGGAGPGVGPGNVGGNAKKASLDSLLWELDGDGVIEEEQVAVGDGLKGSDLHAAGDDETADHYPTAADAASIFEDEVAEILRVAHRQVSGLKLEAAWLRSGLLALQKDVRMLRSENDALQGQRRRADQRLLLLLREKELAEEQRRVAEEQRRAAEDAQETLRGVVSRAVAEAAVLRRQLAVWKPPGGAWAMAVKAGTCWGGEIGASGAVGGGGTSGSPIQRSFSGNSLRSSLEGSGAPSLKNVRGGSALAAPGGGAVTAGVGGKAGGGSSGVSAWAETADGLAGGKDIAHRASHGLVAKESVSPAYKPPSATSGEMFFAAGAGGGKSAAPALVGGGMGSAGCAEAPRRLAEAGRSDSGVWAEVKRVGAGMGLLIDSDVDADEDAALLREENAQLQALLRESQCDLQALEQNVARLKQVVAAQEAAVDAAAVVAADAAAGNGEGAAELGLGNGGKGDWLGGGKVRGLEGKQMGGWGEELQRERERLREAWEEVEKEKQRLVSLRQQLTSGTTETEMPQTQPRQWQASGNAATGGWQAISDMSDDGNADDSESGCIRIVCGSCGAEGVVPRGVAGRLDVLGALAGGSSVGEGDGSESEHGANAARLLEATQRRHSAPSFIPGSPGSVLTSSAAAADAVPDGVGGASIEGIPEPRVALKKAVSMSDAHAVQVGVDLEMVRILELEAQKELLGLLHLSEEEGSPTATAAAAAAAAADAQLETGGAEVDGGVEEVPAEAAADAAAAAAAATPAAAGSGTASLVGGDAADNSPTGGGVGQAGAAWSAANQGLPGGPATVTDLWTAASRAATQLRMSLEAAREATGSGNHAATLSPSSHTRGSVGGGSDAGTSTSVANTGSVTAAKDSNERLRGDMADMALQKRQTVSHLSSLLDDLWQQHRGLQRCLKEMRAAKEICEGCAVCEERRQAAKADEMLCGWG
ncbi:unnamed protein product [Closterium sp. Yama58-4]|nr:unnamed protein product [Closterium sp. Yama58-4]